MAGYRQRILQHSEISNSIFWHTKTTQDHKETFSKLLQALVARLAHSKNPQSHYLIRSKHG